MVSQCHLDINQNGDERELLENGRDTPSVLPGIQDSMSSIWVHA